MAGVVAQPGDAQFVEQFAAAMNPFVPFGAREHLGMVVQKYIANKSQLDMAKWAQAVDLTSHRAGLIVCNDLSVAARYIGQESTAVGGMAPKDKVKELVMYAISPTYFELRQLLGRARRNHDGGARLEERLHDRFAARAGSAGDQAHHTAQLAHLTS